SPVGNRRPARVGRHEGVRVKRPTERPCRCCGRIFSSVVAESSLCSRSCVNRLRKLPTPDQRFWRKVDRRGVDECWPWLGGTSHDGRGRMLWTDGHQWSAPRIAWALEFGSPAERSLHVCHTCDNPNCCNPKHLWLGTSRDNVAD